MNNLVVNPLKNIPDLDRKYTTPERRAKAVVVLGSASTTEPLMEYMDLCAKTTKEFVNLGYNIVTGKLSFEYSQFLDSNDITPTLVAMDMSRVGVVDGDGIRHLSISEGLKLVGYEDYDLNYLENRKDGHEIAFDLLGNSVCVPVIKVISDRLLRKLIAN